ncbi:MAG TPA: alpha/beta hydrolase domain-containing protein [Streptosporangiaceae bacterium]|nr:alpha/beta hydrolase domain-containing protein [Streptosporangiaceae bacterium]
MAIFSGPLVAGTMIHPASMVSVDLKANGYLELEYLASGTARGFEVSGNSGGAAGGAAGESAGSSDGLAALSDGHWASSVSSDTAAFRTRIVVRRPADADRFSGIVLVEWMNVTSAFEADPDWCFLHEEIMRAGHAYVAVSAQAIGVNGGASLLSPEGPHAAGLRADNPARYGALVHPGDRYSFDLFRQVGEALKHPSPDRPAVLGGLRPQVVLALGESQSAYYLTSYINAVQPLAPVYDGFLVHSRGAGAAALSGVPIDPPNDTVPVRIRTDGDAPVIVLVAEGDLIRPLSFWRARQPDSDKIRIWEMAGTSHADSYLIGPAVMLLGCDWRINEGPHRYVAQAALRALVRWCVSRTPPPSATSIKLESERPATIARDQAGIAAGGVRTPVVDVPVVALSGEGPPGTAARMGWLVGSTTPLAPEFLLARYGDRAGYLRAFTESLDEAISEGFLLPEHRRPLLAEAQAFAFPS